MDRIREARMRLQSERAAIQKLNAMKDREKKAAALGETARIGVCERCGVESVIKTVHEHMVGDVPMCAPCYAASRAEGIVD